MMKGALLVLALLVTRELNFKTNEVEACPAFYAVLSALLVGSKTLLNSTLSLVEATDEEKAGFGKMQDCFNEEGFNAKLHIAQIVGSIISDNDCNGYHVSSVLNSVFVTILNVVSLVK
ncbi:secretoglobin family 2B member 2-like [Moschus berezovskii]|uniref:secretoglobin family 2B member 2-like n=1 Tax=Moschus berezovskii TaxID=68408 RepID=UPI002443CEAD|nr:secretoglobin family 2B member 2-like [Moschus berezovskii]